MPNYRKVFVKKGTVCYVIFSSRNAKGTSVKKEAWTNLKKSLPSYLVSGTLVPGSSDVRSWRFVGLSSNDLELEQGIGFIDSLGLIFERFSVLS